MCDFLFSFSMNRLIYSKNADFKKYKNFYTLDNENLILENEKLVRAELPVT